MNPNHNNNRILSLLIFGFIWLLPCSLVTGQNTPPVANDDEYSGVIEGGTLYINSTSGVLSNDTDDDEDVLEAYLVSGPAYDPAFTLNLDGSFTYDNDGSESTTDEFTYRAYDGEDYSNTATVTITITPQNDPPVANPDSYGVTEGGTLNESAPGVLDNDTDPEDDALTAVIDTDPEHSSSFSLNPNGSFTYVHDGSEATSDYFTYMADDGPLQSGLATVTITITPVNDPPELDNIETTALSYEEGDGEVDITSAITVDDNDDANLEGATITISSNYQSDQDMLAFTDAYGITTVDFVSGVLTLSGTASLNNYRNALRSVTYENTSSTPNTSTRTVTFTVNDGDDDSDPVQRDISVGSVNNPPELTEPVSTTVPYTENGSPVQITSSITVDDDDDTNLEGATIVISVNYQNGADILLFTNANGISGGWNAVSGTLTLTGTSSLANYRDALRSITYENTSEDPSEVTRTISFTVDDGTDLSNTVTRNVSVTAVNDPPVVDDIPDQSIGEGGTFTAITLDDYVDDPDHADNEIDWTYAGNSELTVNINSSRVATITIPSPVWHGNETITFTATDPDDDFDSDPAEFTVTAAPILGNIETTTKIYCRNSGKTNITETITISDADDDNLTGATISISGGYENGEDELSYTPADGISGAWSAASGTMTLSGTATLSEYQLALKRVKFENTETFDPVPGIRMISFEVSDGENNSNTESRNINIKVPTATISGSATICEHTTTSIPVYLTGDNPWKFSYRLIGGDTTEIVNVASSPRNIQLQYEGTYQLVEVVDDNNCTGTVSGTAVISVTEAPEVTLTGLAPAYSKETVNVPIYGSPEGGNFNCDAVPNPLFLYEGTMHFWPIMADPDNNPHIVTYSYQDPGTSCYGYDTAIVNVLEADAGIIFPDNKQFYCTNDDQFTISGYNFVEEIGYFIIVPDMGLTDNGDNTAVIDPSAMDADDYLITYYYEDGGIWLDVAEPLIIGNPPEAKFKWETECFQTGQAINFTDQSIANEGVITSYKWLFYTGSGYDSLMTKNTTYIYAQPGNYIVELQIETSNQCTDETVRVFGLRPTVQLAGQTYFEDFEDSPISWRSGTSETVTRNSWDLGLPVKGFSGASSGVNCWHTYIPVSNPPQEQSWVTSPCFDFTDTERPMVKLDIWRLFNATRDGAVLQATADSGKTWQNVGILDDGINWFNRYSISGNPGGQGIGWSDIRDFGWLEARHDLNAWIGKQKVQFRIAYGSDGTALNTDGIAFDDFWIGERNKVALIEHFTNSSDQESKDANLIINELVSNNSANVLDLQYHTSFPGYDPFNEHNPSIPLARLLNYGLSTIPYSILDGGTTGQHRFDYIGSGLYETYEKEVLIRSLLNSRFQIHTTGSIVGNSLKVSAEISATENIPASEITVHLAVIEDLIDEETGNNGETEFYSVVKTLLPDAGGTTFYQPWTKGVPQEINHSWNMQYVYDLNALRVVTFIQNEQTKEVYQSAIDTVKIITGIEDPLIEEPDQHTCVIFPNPASTQVYIRFNEILRQNVNLDLYNSMGSLVYAGLIKSGEIEFELPVENYPDGVYFIRLTSGNELFGSGKFTIAK